MVRLRVLARIDDLCHTVTFAIGRFFGPFSLAPIVDNQQSPYNIIFYHLLVYIPKHTSHICTCKARDTEMVCVRQDKFIHVIHWNFVPFAGL